MPKKEWERIVRLNSPYGSMAIPAALRENYIRISNGVRGMVIREDSPLGPLVLFEGGHQTHVPSHWLTTMEP